MADISIDRQGHVLLIGFNRPRKLNAMTPEMYSTIAAAYGRLDADPALRVGVLYGAGDHLTAGLQLDAWTDIFASGGLPELDDDQIDPFGVDERRCAKPIVMAAQGYCYTVGVEMMLNTEVRVAASDTRFAMLEVKRGIYPVGGATVRLPREIGWANAQRYLLTGDEWTAQQALDWGLITEMCEPGLQLDRALALAERIARAAPLGVQAALRSTRLTYREGERRALDQLLPDLQPIMASDDVKEGVASFLERREARFRGR